MDTSVDRSLSSLTFLANAARLLAAWSQQNYNTVRTVLIQMSLRFVHLKRTIFRNRTVSGTTLMTPQR